MVKFRIVVCVLSMSLVALAAPIRTASPALAAGNGTGLKGDYFSGSALAPLNLVATRTDATVNFAWGSGSPATGVPANSFSARWTGYVQPLYSQSYTFCVETDDGARLWVNKVQVVNRWVNGFGETCGTPISLTANQKYVIRFEMYENTGSATAKLRWQSPGQAKQIVPQTQLYVPGTGTGIRGEYYNGTLLTPPALLVRTDAKVNFDWGFGSPAPSVPIDKFSVQWAGLVEPLYTGTYTFCVESDDGTQLWVDGWRVVNKIQDQGYTRWCGTTALTANQKVLVKMLYYENIGGAAARLFWSSADQPEEIVPTSQLYLATATSPGQAASGPGGSNYSWAGVNAQYHSVVDPAPNKDARSYWTYEPTTWQGGGSTPARVPIIVLNHGHCATNPADYQSWINHMVRKGNLVVYPLYQPSVAPDWSDCLQIAESNYTPNAISSVQLSIAWLEANATTKPDTAVGMLVTGHSMGGMVSVNLANRAATNGLPTPKAVLAVEPYFFTIDTPLSGIPAATRFVCVVGNSDNIVGRWGCDEIWDRSTHIPAANRNYVWVPNDPHSYPDLIADHFFPVGNSMPVNALDWRGEWKWADALRDCGLYGTNCAYAIGNTPQQKDLGTWSDGVVVRQPTVTSTKPACPVPSYTLGC